MDGVRDGRLSAAWRRRTVLLIALLFIARWIYAACVPLELVADEAYYWDWSRQLDWGYYSKPPLVAWIIRLATAVGGSTAWAVRTPAVLLGTLSLWWIFLLAARIFDARVGFWSVVLCAATPGNTVLGLLMTIDAPFLFCWGMATYCLWRMLERGSRRRAWIPAAGLSTGLGLLSKESMIAFLMVAWFFVLLSRNDRRELKRPGWWLMTFLALACITPVIVWNSQHDWITLRHSSSHFALQETGLAARLLRSGEFIAGQLGMISPATYIVFVATGSLALRGWRRLTRPALFLLCFSVIPLLGVFGLSLTRRVMPNWPAPFYETGIILTTAWLLGRLEFGEVPSPLRRLFPSGAHLLQRSVWCGIICVGLTCLSPWAVHWLELAGSKADPTVRLRGWNDLADQVARNRTLAPHPEATFVLVATARQEASELAFYLPEQPLVSLWNPTGRVLSQYDLRPEPVDRTGWDAVIVTGPASGIDPRLAQQFAHAERCAAPVDIPLGNGRSRQYALWLGRDYRPPPPETRHDESRSVARVPSTISAR